MNEADILDTAKLMIAEHGAEAAAHAARRADRALLQGSVEGEQIWRRVIAVILELQASG